MKTQPTRCLRCHGLLVSDGDDPTIWRCVNCGCYGTGWHVWGSVVGCRIRAAGRLNHAGVRQDHSRRQRTDDDEDQDES